MKIYISLDMEGVAGTVSWEQEKNDHAYMRKYMTQQVEWLVEGIRKSEVNELVEEILVADSHGNGDNISYDITAVDDRIHLVSGSPRPYYMMPALDESYDVVFLAGYHSGAGTAYGVMDHSFTGCFHNIAINGVPVNEALMNSAFAGCFNVPVGLVIGDEALDKELKKEDALSWVHFVTTKIGLSRYAAKNRPMAVVKKETIEAVKQVLTSDLKQIPRYHFAYPLTLTIEFQNTAMTDVVAMLPGIKRLDGRTIELMHTDYKTIYNARSAIATLAGCFRS